MTKINKWTKIPYEDGCLLWSGHISVYGYGLLRTVGYSENLVHRIVFEAHVRELHPGEQVDHVCHNRSADAGGCQGGVTCLHRRCINPEHMRATTNQSNLEASPLTHAGRKARREAAQGF